MKVFIFWPSKICIGELEISSVQDIAQAVETFIGNHPETEDFSYVECGPREWTITSASPFELQEGVVEEKPLTSPDGAHVGAEIVEWLGMLLFMLAQFLLVGALLSLFASIVTWLRSGNWTVCETELLLNGIPAFRSWFEFPNTWLGAHKLVSTILKTPWSFTLAALFFWFAVSLDNIEASAGAEIPRKPSIRHLDGIYWNYPTQLKI